MARIPAFAVTAVLVFAAPQFARASLIVNGGFEGGTSTKTLKSYDDTYDDIEGWTVTTGSIDWAYKTYWLPSGGDCSIDLAGLASGAVRQSFSTVIGQEYLLTFDMSGNPDGGPSTKSMDVTVAGSVSSFTFDSSDSTHDDMGWIRQSVAFTASDTTTTVEFLDTTGGWFGAVIDSASADAQVVPEPASLVLWSGLGVIGLIAARCRRKVA